MSSTYGENLKLSIFGQSHGPAIGMTLDGIPAGLQVDPEKLQSFLNRRAPGRNDWSPPAEKKTDLNFCPAFWTVIPAAHPLPPSFITRTPAPEIMTI